MRIPRRNRQKTTTEHIILPYHNGILHGTDFCYDDKIVSADTELFLFAMDEWATKFERGKTLVPEIMPESSLIDIGQAARNKVSEDE